MTPIFKSLSLETALPPGWQGPGTIDRMIGGAGQPMGVSCGFESGPRNHRNIVVSGYHIIYVLAGRGHYIDWDDKQYEVSPGTIMQRLPGRRHSTLCDMGDEWVECYICLPKFIFENMEMLALPVCKWPIFHPGLDAQLLGLFQNALTTLKNARPMEVAGFLVDAMQIVRHMTALVQQTQQPRAQHVGIIEEAQQLLDHPPTHRHALKQLVTRHSISHERFRKIFKNATGLSLGEYRIRRRIETACGLLQNSDLFIKQIALNLEFSNVQSFSRQFSQRIGYSPSHFRRMFRSTRSS